MATPLARLAVLLMLQISIQCTTAFHPPKTSIAQATTSPILFIRGGSDSEYDESEYDTDEEEEPIIQKTKVLASSTKSKLATAKKAAAKSAAAKAMASSKPVKTSGGSVTQLYRRMVPHIVRCVLNPFTFVRMTRAYFASLMDINYMKEVSNGRFSLFAIILFCRG